MAALKALSRGVPLQDVCVMAGTHSLDFIVWMFYRHPPSMEALVLCSHGINTTMQHQSSYERERLRVTYCIKPGSLRRKQDAVSHYHTSSTSARLLQTNESGDIVCRGHFMDTVTYYATSPDFVQWLVLHMIQTSEYADNIPSVNVIF